jgi:hypothetical protein
VTSQSADTLRSRYVAQAASDLEENRRLQRELAERISTLKQEEALLQDILRLAEGYDGPPTASPSATENSSAPEEPEAAASEGRGIPAARRSGPAESGAPAEGADGAVAAADDAPAPESAGDTLGQTAAESGEKASGDARPAQPARKAAKSRASGKSARKKGKSGSGKTKPRQPLLGDLLTQLLSQYQEPRLAKELREELLEKHPDRRPTPQVVRNTLESLVAKGRIQRHKQQRSVLYTLVDQEKAG